LPATPITSARVHSATLICITGAGGAEPPSSATGYAVRPEAMAPSPLTLADLERWELFGATWRVVELSDEWAVLDMCACTGQLVERRTSDDRALIAHVRAAEANAAT
jgi:hypothetical protein